MAVGAAADAARGGADLSLLHSMFLIAAAGQPARGYRPFLDPMEIHEYWWLTLIPLALGISMAYKAIRLEDLSRFWGQALLMTAQVVAGMIGLAIAAYLVVELIVYRWG